MSVKPATLKAWSFERSNIGAQDYHQSRARGPDLELAHANCWCGQIPGSCVDCHVSDELNPMIAAGKLNISSGEDAFQ